MRQERSGATARWTKRRNIAWHELGEPWQCEKSDMKKRESERRNGRKTREKSEGSEERTEGTTEELRRRKRERLRDRRNTVRSCWSSSGSGSKK